MQLGHFAIIDVRFKGFPSKSSILGLIPYVSGMILHVWVLNVEEQTNQSFPT